MLHVIMNCFLQKFCNVCCVFAKLFASFNTIHSPERTKRSQLMTRGLSMVGSSGVSSVQEPIIALTI